MPCRRYWAKILVWVVGEVFFPSFCPERGDDVFMLRGNGWIVLHWLVFQGFEVLRIPVPSLLQVAERLTCCMESNCESAFVSPSHLLDPINPRSPPYSRAIKSTKSNRHATRTCQIRSYRYARYNHINIPNPTDTSQLEVTK